MIVDLEEGCQFRMVRLEAGEEIHIAFRGDEFEIVREMWPQRYRHGEAIGKRRRATPEALDLCDLAEIDPNSRTKHLL